MTGELGTLDGQDGVGQAATLRGQPPGRGGLLGTGELVRGGQPDGPGDVLRAGTAMPLLAATVLLGQEVRS